jgi:Kef-type K+ transport system membrane component KefB
MAIAFAVPLALSLALGLRVPAVVLELLAGIVVCPSGLGLVEVDAPVDVLALLGLAMLLFPAGLEIELDALRGPLLRAGGLRFDLAALTADLGALAKVPILLACLLAVRGLPAMLYRRVLGSSAAVAAAGLRQATSLPFIVAATAIGAELEVLRPDTAAGLVAAGLLSLLLFPAGALTLLRRGGGPASS